MKEFEFYMPTKIIFGNGKLQMAWEVTSQYGKRCIIVTGKSYTQKSGLLDKLIKILKAHSTNTVVFDQVEPNPSTQTVERGARLARDNKCDVLVAIGGGSPIDAGKAIAVMATHRGRVWEYVESDPEKGINAITERTLPIIAIPTTAGTGSETTKYAVITNTELKIKDTFVSPYIFPKVSIVDPELMLPASPKLTAITGIDAFTHALEGFTSKKSQPITDSLALDALNIIVKNLPKAVANPEDLNVRTNLAWASTLAGIVIANAGCTLGHAMAHPVGGHYGISHGEALSAITVPTMRFNLIGCIDKYAQVASIFKGEASFVSSRESGQQAPELVQDFIKELGLITSLCALGVKKEGIKSMSKDALNMGALNCNIRRPSQKEIEEIYLQAF